ncbi:hypothetical protein CONCODRAFT_30944, partial [Conidiobolus coronatus NRRL 28638]
IDGIAYFLDCYDMYMLPYFAYYINTVYFGGNIPYIYDCLLRTAAPIGSLFVKFIILIFPIKIQHPIPNIGLILVMASSLGISLTGNGSGVNFIAALVFWRFALGIGLALEDPYKAILNLPSAKTATTPKLVMKAVYISLTCAILLGFVVSLVVSGSFKFVENDQIPILDYVWRIFAGNIFFPAAVILYCRMTRNIEGVRDEKCREETLIEGRNNITSGIIEDKEPRNFSWKESIAHFSKPKNFIVLTGGMYLMFVTSLIFWGYAWNLGTIFFLIGYVDPNWSLGTINFAVAVGVLTVAFGGIPGFFASISLIERIGRRNLHLLGFGGMTLINLILGFAFDRVKTTSSHLFVWLLTLESVFAQLAPNGTVLTKFNPTMSDPEQEPSSKGYYLTAMVLGLIASQFLFTYTKNIGGPSAFIHYTFQIYSYLSISALLITFLLPD